MKKQLFTALIAVFLILFTSYPASAGRKETRKIEDAIDVMEAIMAIPEKSIPENLLREAHAIAIIPSVIKAGYVVGGKFGRGVVLTHNKSGWSYPSFITIAGASLGFQVGAQSSDVILIFRTKKSVDGLRRAKFTLGADATVAAGPVGRHGEAATDITLKAEIYSYSRSRGLFAGVSLEGAAIVTDQKSNSNFYNEDDIGVYEIFDGTVKTVPGIVHKLISTLER
ncbi:MAG: lipid-binding SYLF domain-containing protein [Thermodesulfobacteriota bacterium]